MTITEKITQQLEAAGMARTAPAPPRPRDRGDRWSVAADWAVTVAAGLFVLAIAGAVGVLTLFGVLDGGVRFGLTGPQALALAGVGAAVLLPAALFAVHRWVRPPRRDRQPDDVDALAASVADNPNRRGFSDVDLWRLVAARQTANEQMRGRR